jgi:hypothetical protein
MALEFKCSYCGLQIISKFLSIGEEIECKNCKNSSIIPNSAAGISEALKRGNTISDTFDNDMESSSKTSDKILTKKVDEGKVKDKKSSSKNTGLHVDIEAMFGEPLLKVDGGVTEILYLYKKKLVIAPRKTLLGKIEGGGHEIIYLKHIKDIEFKYGGTLANGYIQFRTSSSGNNKKSGILPGFETANDPNTVHFRKKINDKMFKILKLVDKCIEN